MASAEEQLNNLLQKLLDEGVEVVDPRTGESTLALFDEKIVVQEGEFPWFTQSAATPRLAFEELWFFLRCKTQTKELEKKGCFFWKGNTSREALDKIGLNYLAEGDLGTAYSLQWRDFGGGVATGEGVDQFENLIEGIRNNKYSRRHLVTLWNPLESDSMTLTPCHHTSQYVVLPSKNGDVLHVKLVNRSLDCLYGLKFAIQQYRMFQMALCRMFGFKLGKLSVDLSNYHIYSGQIDYVKEYLQRDATPHEHCSIAIKDEYQLGDMQDLLEMEWDCWDVVYKYNKQPFVTPKPAMVA